MAALFAYKMAAHVAGNSTPEHPEPCVQAKEAYTPLHSCFPLTLLQVETLILRIVTETKPRDGADGLKNYSVDTSL